jgi:SP family general alpha glucoside:H+ symporter-like MFS transporter
MWMKVAGGRTLYLVGLGCSLIILAATGGVGTIPTTPVTSWTLGSLTVVLAFVFDTTIGPVRVPSAEKPR